MCWNELLSTGACRQIEDRILEKGRFWKLIPLKLCVHVLLGKLFVTLQLYTFPSLKTTVIEKGITFKRLRTVIQRRLEFGRGGTGQANLMGIDNQAFFRQNM